MGEQRAVTHRDHPGTEGSWKRRIESQLEKLFTQAATALQRVIDDGDVAVKGGGSLLVQDGGDVAVQGGGSFRVEDNGDIVLEDGGLLRVEDANGATIWTNLDGPTQHSVAQIDRNSGVALSSSYTQVAVANFTVPAGYTRGHITVFGSAGTTLSGSGNLSVQPYIGSTAGPAINSGNSTGGPCTASSYFGANYEGMVPGLTLGVVLYALLTGTSQGASYNNAHLTVTVTWLR